MNLEPEISLASDDERSSSHHGVVLKGFELLAVAATFLSAVQAQVMGVTISIRRDEETVALRAVNALFLSGLIFSLISAFLAFLTARWLQRLTDKERKHLEVTFEAQSRVRRGSRRRRNISRDFTIPEARDADAAERGDNLPQESPSQLGQDKKNSSHTRPQISSRLSPRVGTERSPGLIVRLAHWYFAYSLFAPMSLLVTGVVCMTVGLLIFAWAEHSLAVALTLTCTCVAVLPLVVGVFMIGQNSATRIAVIDIVGKKQGDW